MWVFLGRVVLPFHFLVRHSSSSSAQEAASCALGTWSFVALFGKLLPRHSSALHWHCCPSPAEHHRPPSKKLHCWSIHRWIVEPRICKDTPQSLESPQIVGLTFLGGSRGAKSEEALAGAWHITEPTLSTTGAGGVFREIHRVPVHPDIWMFPPAKQAVKCWVWVTIWLNAAFVAKGQSADFEIQHYNISTVSQ